MLSQNETRAEVFTASEWHTHQTYLRHIKAACAAEGVKLEWQSEYWVAKMSKGAQTHFIVGHTLPLNNAGAQAIARDKVATFAVLQSSQIPAVRHQLVRFPSHQWDPHAVPRVSQFPLVLKPCVSGRGNDIYKVNSRIELLQTLEKMAQRYFTVALSPYETIEDEYRVVMIGNEPKLLFRKQRPVDAHGQTIEWRHNLSLGATAQPVASGTPKDTLFALAARSMQAMDLAFAAVDIIKVPEGFKILEVNASPSLSHASDIPAFDEKAAAIYREVIARLFKNA